MNSRKLPWLGLIAAAFVFGGCSTTGMKDTMDGGDGAAVVEGGDGATTAGAAGSGRWTGNPLDNPASLLSTRTVYFDFDRSEIRPESVETLRAHAGYLASNPGATLMIEGHCDERGSREYNIGLGERRASAVQRFLEAEGVDPTQINTISYGEERPAVFGHNESAWAMNRRAVLVY